MEFVDTLFDCFEILYSVTYFFQTLLLCPISFSSIRIDVKSEMTVLLLLNNDDRKTSEWDTGKSYI